MTSFLARPTTAGLLVALFALACVPVAAATAEPSPPPGPVVLSRAHGDALAIWDATADLTALLANKTSAEDALRRLEADAVTVMAEKAKLLPSDAKTLTVQVIYQRTGAISPTYQVATFAGIERLLTVKAPVNEIAAKSAAWSAELRVGKTPAALTVTVAGKLPPELH